MENDLEEFNRELDQRLAIVKEKIEAAELEIEELVSELEYLDSAKPEFNEDIFEFANDSVLKYLDYCTEYPSERCTEDAKEMLRLCSIDASVKACSDHRIKEIANLGSNQNIDQQIETPKLNRNCQPDIVCVKQGDFLKYKADETVVYFDHDFDGNLTYTFGDFIDANRIEVNLTFDANDDKHYFQERIMDVSTGLLEPPELIVDPTVSKNTLPHSLYSISPSLLTYDELDRVTIEHKIFGGWHGKGDRETIVLRNPDPDVVVIIDDETRVIIFSAESRYGGGYNTNYVLIDTNIFG